MTILQYISFANFVEYKIIICSKKTLGSEQVIKIIYCAYMSIHKDE